VEHARERLAAERAQYFLLRGAPHDNGDTPDEAGEYVMSIVNTKQASEEIWRQIKKKTRWYIRQGEKQGFSIRVDSELANIDAFYALYAAHVHRLGTPVMGRRMMQAMARYLGPQRLRLLLVERSGEMIGGMMIVIANRGFLDLYALVQHDLRDTAAGYLLYWKALELAAREGAAELNLGRSAVGSGTHLFKTKWGGRDEPLIYRRYFASGARQRHGLEKFRSQETLAQRMWKHLPLWAANSIGPLLRRQLPFG
jgi:lipid II:glycine glycyltransferase (peptidoglycan interpeptide bridge formation enzyme)